MKYAIHSTLKGIGICRANYKLSVSFWKPDPKSARGAKGFLNFNDYVDAFRAHSALEQTSSLSGNTLFIPALEVFHRPWYSGYGWRLVGVGLLSLSLSLSLSLCCSFVVGSIPFPVGLC